ncbi:MAG: TonB-dependent receptor plug domain-containing protein [Sphingomonadales bacterium]|nr:TonB-dependent receptor plug domain-containing protein [Sphingomonadales bacterium]MDE2170792.1 TonB-dependent receptor plug domain-containing protein [Sphingomonadales bacterium]
MHAAPHDSGPEIIVTAQKTEQRLLDVPAPVTALAASTLTQNNKVRLQDFYQSVPGLNVVPNDYDGSPVISIRGITTGGATSPTVGITIDDVPLNASTSLASGEIVPDFDPSDLQRIEVLRGPQGTLYGASSLGGLLKFVTKDPSTAGISGHVETDIDGITGSNGLGYGGSAAINLPVANQVAISLSGFGRHQPGYIDNVLTGQKDVNSRDSEGVHGSLLWRPGADTSLKLSAFFQHTQAYGSSIDDTLFGLGDLEQSQARGTGTFDRSTTVFSAVGKTVVGRFQLVSVTGYSINHLRDAFDASYLLSGLSQADYGDNATGSVITNDVITRKFSEELRLSTSFGNIADWIVGGFYTHESTNSLQSAFAVNAFSGAFQGSYVNEDHFPSTYQEFAIFTDVTFHVTERFQVQVGGRESRNNQSYHETITGPDTLDLDGAPSPIIQPLERSHDSSFTFLVTPQFKISRDLMIYGRIASGYRPGGPNVTATVFNIPPTYNADRTVNYEVGSKGSLFGGKLTFDASLYYIDWKNIQLLLLNDNGSGYFSNGSRARSKGVELSSEWHPLTGLKISGFASYGKAELAEELPAASPAYGAKGDLLPYSERFSGNIAAEQRLALAEGVNVFLGGEFSRVGRREGIFRSTSVRQIYPGYNNLDIHARLAWSDWSANLYMTNVTNKRGELTGGIGSLDPVGFQYIQPRTTGLSLSRNF